MHKKQEQNISKEKDPNKEKEGKVAGVARTTRAGSGWLRWRCASSAWKSSWYLTPKLPVRGRDPRDTAAHNRNCAESRAWWARAKHPTTSSNEGKWNCSSVKRWISLGQCPPNIYTVFSYFCLSPFFPRANWVRKEKREGSILTHVNGDPKFQFIPTLA